MVRTERLPIIELMYYNIGIYRTVVIISVLRYRRVLFEMDCLTRKPQEIASVVIHDWRVILSGTHPMRRSVLSVLETMCAALYIIFSSRFVFAENHTGWWLQKRQNVCVKNQQVTEVVAVVVVVATDDLRQRVCL